MVPSTSAGALPGVSVILPVRNEEHYLAAAIDRVRAQSYRGPLQIVMAVGPSHDRTEELAASLAEQDDRVVVVPNPSGRTPDGLNLAIAAARHDVLVRVDGHSEIDPDYVERAVATLLATGAANVGGMMVPVGTTPFEHAVARAMSSRIGIGPVGFHTGGQAGPAETVYLGVFRKDVVERVGGFDEHFTRAQDWELNHRIRAAGEQVWFDPELRVRYRPRSTMRALARQFQGSGQWRRQVIARYPRTASPRYLAPPLALIGVAVGTVAGVVGAVSGTGWLRWGALLPAGYVLVVLGGAAVAGRGLPTAARLRLPAVAAVMHMSWGWGFLRGT